MFQILVPNENIMKFKVIMRVCNNASSGAHAAARIQRCAHTNVQAHTHVCVGAQMRMCRRFRMQVCTHAQMH